MDRATLNGIEGSGELHVTRSPDGAEIRGVWQSVGYRDLDSLRTVEQSGEVVIYHGLIRDPERPTEEIIQDVSVRVQNIDTEQVADTGDVEVTAMLEAIRLPHYLDSEE